MSLEDAALYLDPSLGISEPISLAGAASVLGAFEDSTEIIGGDVISVAPTVLLLTADAPAAAEGQTLTRAAGGTYRVRQVLPVDLNPQLLRLVLARV